MVGRRTKFGCESSLFSNGDEKNPDALTTVSLCQTSPPQVSEQFRNALNFSNTSREFEEVVKNWPRQCETWVN